MLFVIMAYYILTSSLDNGHKIKMSVVSLLTGFTFSVHYTATEYKPALVCFGVQLALFSSDILYKSS